MGMRDMRDRIGSIAYRVYGLTSEQQVISAKPDVLAKKYAITTSGT